MLYKMHDIEKGWQFKVRFIGFDKKANFTRNILKNSTIVSLKILHDFVINYSIKLHTHVRAVFSVALLLLKLCCTNLKQIKKMFPFN